MRRITLISLLVAVLAVAGVGLSHFEKYEDDVIFVAGDQAYDPLGVARNLYNRVSRDCSAVVEVPRQSKEGLEIQAELSHMKDPYPTAATPLRIMRLGSWVIVESEFADLEPAIFVLSREQDQRLGQGKLHIHKEGTWSGTTAPLKPGPIIRAYMQRQIPMAPEALIRCFEPTLGHFSN